jgi:hypothetical protein
MGRINPLLGTQPRSTPGRVHRAASGRSTEHANHPKRSMPLQSAAPKAVGPSSPCHVPMRPGWPRRTTSLLWRHPPWQPGQTETATAGGADPRSPRTRPRMDQIEYRLFSHISTNWRGRRWSPTTHCRVDRGDLHPLGSAGPGGAGPGQLSVGVRVCDRELAAVPLRRHHWHGEWNYTVLPAAAQAHGNQPCHAGTLNGPG